MATLDEIGQEKQRISERLVRLDAERTNLGDQLSVLGNRGARSDAIRRKARRTEKRRRGRPARTAPAAGKSPQRSRRPASKKGN